MSVTAAVSTGPATGALPLWHAALVLTPAAAAVFFAAVAARASTVASSWRLARAASLTMVVGAVLAVLVRAVTDDRAGMLVRSDSVGVAMLSLVSFIGWVVIRYSRSYLSGDPYEQSYVARLLATVAAVAVVVVANDLIVLVLAWTATSLALHGLLTFFGDRPVAIAVAHKKFILARCADVAMVAAVVAFASTFRTFRIDRIVSGAVVAGSLPTGARVGIALVALAALLKCAQLPFHGWLIQVMEAPTPVSALLHAGVVNLGGFVLLRFSPVVDRATETRALLVIVGTVTAVVAALVMTTRISVKVSLAWSTCAQMGFMLMQCGLGAWEMALLHLLAHSLYKAHAFLGAGGVVRLTQRKQLAMAPVAPTATSVSAAFVVAALTTFGAGWMWGSLPFTEHRSSAFVVLGLIVALAMVPLISVRMKAVGSRVSPKMFAAAIGVPLTYFALHDLFAHIVVGDGSAAPSPLLVLVAAAFVALFLVQAICAIAPSHPLVTRMYPWVYGGLFIDEAFTRVAFAVWAPPPPRSRVAPLPQRAAVAIFARATPQTASVVSPSPQVELLPAWNVA